MKPPPTQNSWTRCPSPLSFMERIDNGFDLPMKYTAYYAMLYTVQKVGIVVDNSSPYVCPICVGLSLDNFRGHPIWCALY